MILCARAKSAPPETCVSHIVSNVSDIEPTTGPSCAQLLDSRLVPRLCGILLAVEIALFLFLAAGSYGLIVPLPKPTSTDFVSFYAAGGLADLGTPELAYNRDAHYAAEERATEPGIVYNFFYYPPVFLLLCGALARLPYLTAFVVFEATTFGFYLLVLRSI
jgi:alpha-1,2-mannosyltransferase